MFIIHSLFLFCFDLKIYLSKFLINNFRWLSRFFIFNIFYYKLIKVNNNFITKNIFIFFGDIIHFFMFTYSLNFVNNICFIKNKFLINLLFFNVFYESSHFFVLNKPSGFLVHSGGKNFFNILDVFRLLYKHSINLVHRLDRYTTGCLIFSKSYFFSKLFFKIFYLGKINKVYYCLINSIFFGSLLVSVLLKRCNKITSKFLKGYSSLMLIRAIHCFENYTLLSISIYTGKRHQIRICCSYFSISIVGDRRYVVLDYVKHKKVFYEKKLFLHARSVEFFIPNTNIFYFFKAPFDYYFCFIIFLLYYNKKLL